jgi:hypothetical protein
MSAIPCPRCLGGMWWTQERSRWKCRCGKTIAVTVIVDAAAEAMKRGSEPHAIRALSLPGSTPQDRQLAVACPLIH